METVFQALPYSGFWTRFFAMVLDTIILLFIIVALLYLFFGAAVTSNPEAVSGPLAFTINNGLPLLYTVLFWRYWAATPGKKMMGVCLVDARTGGPVPLPRLVLRYFAYIVSALPLFLGFIWVVFDKHKRGFHDIIAGTLVVHATSPEATTAHETAP